MVNIIVLKPFYDLSKKVDRKVGDVFDATEERAAQIEAALPGYVSVEKPVDYNQMTAQQLIALAKERGVMPKGRVSKAQLIEILSKE